MDIALSSCFLIVSDPDKALAFYRDVLGLEVRMDVPNDSFRWITVGAPSQPGVGIVLTNYLNSGPADQDAVDALLSQGSANGLQFTVDDLDAFFERARSAGGQVEQEPTDQPWGPRDCVFKDPSGNTVRVLQAAS